jgi:hypothetical protein
MNKQITKAKFDVKVDNGATNASFQGFPKEVELYSGGYEWKPYYYGGQPTDQALSGKLRSFLGGYRIEGRLNWERLTNTQNLANVVNKAVVGTEKLFWTTITPASYNSNLNIGINDTPGVSAYFQGMKVQFNGAQTRTITNYNQSNAQITLNLAVTVNDADTVSIYALANMTPRVYIYPDTTNSRNEEIVLTDTAWSFNLESTIMRQPLSVDFRGTNVETTIPVFYDL